MLNKDDWEELHKVFVEKNDCTKKVEEQNKKFANDDKRLAVIEVYQKLTLAVLSAVGAGVLAIVLNVFSGGML